MILNAKNIIFLVSGKDKARVTKDVIEGGSNPLLPASLVMPRGGKLFFFLDSDSSLFLNREDIK